MCEGAEAERDTHPMRIRLTIDGTPRDWRRIGRRMKRHALRFLVGAWTLVIPGRPIRDPKKRQLPSAASGE